MFKRILRKLLMILIFIIIVTCPMWSVALGWWLTEVTVHGAMYEYRLSWVQIQSQEHYERTKFKHMGLEVKYDKFR